MKDLLDDVLGAEFSKIDRFRNRDGRYWYKVLDLCKLLGLKNTTVSVRGDNICVGYFAIDPDEVTQFGLSPKSPLYITEAAVFKLILKSRKPLAHAIKNKISEEVLPQIERTGEYRKRNKILKNVIN